MLRAHFTATTPDQDHKVEVELQVDQQVLVFHGPSGVGKTLALRTLAGLIRPSTGRIEFEQEVWDNAVSRVHLPIHRRKLGLVSQDPSLFPFTSVAGNVGFGLARRTVSPRVQQLMAQFEIEELAQADPATLSGGERQRVAIARALAPSPRLLLMDEPFSALDRASRSRLLPVLSESLDSLTGTAIVVTHDLEDAQQLGGSILHFESVTPGFGRATMQVNS